MQYPLSVCVFVCVCVCVPLTVLSLCVHADMCSRSVARRVEGSDRDAAVPLVHHQERRHLCDVFNESVLQPPILRRLVAHLVSKDTTPGIMEVRILLRDGTFVESVSSFCCTFLINQ